MQITSVSASTHAPGNQAGAFRIAKAPRTVAFKTEVTSPQATVMATTTRSPPTPSNDSWIVTEFGKVAEAFDEMRMKQSEHERERVAFQNSITSKINSLADGISTKVDPLLAQMRRMGDEVSKASTASTAMKEVSVRMKELTETVETMKAQAGAQKLTSAQLCAEMSQIFQLPALMGTLATNMQKAKEEALMRERETNLMMAALNEKMDKIENGGTSANGETSSSRARRASVPAYFAYGSAAEAAVPAETDMDIDQAEEPPTPPPSGRTSARTAAAASVKAATAKASGTARNGKAKANAANV